MRRWNGWGDDTVEFHLSLSTKAFLENKIGKVVPPRDITLEEAVSQVPESRLPDHPLISKEKKSRVTHSVGQSLPDWIALRSGLFPAFPDGVAFPETEDEVAELLSFAKEIGAVIIPYGGGTSVVGHLTVPSGEKSVISVDMGRMNRLISLDKKSGLAQFQAGVKGPDLEAALRAEGYTLGHFPQSFEYSTLGGWVVTRSAGQFSYEYGRIERLFVGGTVVTPKGMMHIPIQPASAAGPDLREFILGSEGRLGILTSCTVRVTPLPEEERFQAAFFPNPEQGLAAVRKIAQAKIPLTMVRLSLPEETSSMLAMNGESKALALLNAYLGVRGVKEGRCMLLYGASGDRKKVRGSLRQSNAIIKAHQGVAVGTKPGKQWYKKRFHMPYARNTFWEMGYAIDTVETSTVWTRVPEMISETEQALRSGLMDLGENVHVFTHLSHVYPHGSSIYTTFLFRIAADPNETFARWRQLKQAVSEAIVRTGGTISHQHGVGLDHRPYVEAEKGELGLEMIQAICSTLDPDGMMNPGKLIP